MEATGGMCVVMQAVHGFRWGLTHHLLCWPANAHSRNESTLQFPAAQWSTTCRSLNKLDTTMLRATSDRLDMSERDMQSADRLTGC